MVSLLILILLQQLQTPEVEILD